MARTFLTTNALLPVKTARSSMHVLFDAFERCSIDQPPEFIRAFARQRIIAHHIPLAKVILKQQPLSVQLIHTPNQLAVVMAEGAEAAELSQAGGRQQQSHQQRVEHLLTHPVRVRHSRLIKRRSNPLYRSRSPQ